MTRVLALISGGLDSTLAAKIIAEQGIEVIGICFKSAFFGPANAIRMAEQVGIPLKVVDFTEEHIKMTRNPKHGYGKNMNPCIDCHAMMLNYAGRMLGEMGADFLITGEVLNQRPMSQTLGSLNVVKKESGYASKILRPLCAKNLSPTEMEMNGLVDREKLLDIKGRSRKIQMELAEHYGIEDYPSPAGGCKLTEPGFARRLRDLYTYDEKLDLNDIEILKIGRHFRISPRVYAVSTRDSSELEVMRPLIREGDLLFEASDFSGTVVLLRGSRSVGDLEIAARIAARYCKGSGLDDVAVRYGTLSDMDRKSTVHVKPASDEDLDGLLI